MKKKNFVHLDVGAPIAAGLDKAVLNIDAKNFKHELFLTRYFEVFKHAEKTASYAFRDGCL